jgi:hypothetical protein
MGSWCNARLVVVGRSIDVTRFRRLAGVPVARIAVTPLTPSAEDRASRVFRGDMLVGEAQGLFCERATRIGKDRLEKIYFFQASDEDGHEHFRDLSRLWLALRLVYVYGWDSWNEYSYGSHLICRGYIHSYHVPIQLVEKAMVKHGVDDNPNNEWPYQPEVDAETELMDLAQAHWKESLLRK